MTPVSTFTLDSHPDVAIDGEITSETQRLFYELSKVPGVRQMGNCSITLHPDDSPVARRMYEERMKERHAYWEAKLQKAHRRFREKPTDKRWKKFLKVIKDASEGGGEVQIGHFMVRNRKIYYAPEGVPLNEVELV